MEKSLIRVLLVESDARFGRLIRESLSNLTGSPITLDICGSLSSALAELRRNPGDAVLLNLFLSDSEGIGTLKRLQEQSPNLPIVILTCHESELLALEAVRRGAQDYLIKSRVDGKTLTRVIRYAIERKRTELKLMAANSQLIQANFELARSEDALRRALEELRASHQRLKTAQLQLIQSEKLECIGTLAAGVAHEVKNPLQTILMGLAYLNSNLSGPDDTLFMVLSDMREAVKRADAIVRDLLYLSLPRQIEMKEEDINSVIEHSLSFVNFDLTRSRVQVRRELGPGLPPVRLDKQKIEQVFINLFMNAIHAMPEGGDLLLRSRLWLSPGDFVNGPSRFQFGGPAVCVEIEDSGPGIPSEKVESIFKPFFTTKRNGLGTGLGLPVSRQIVELHGGSIFLGPGSLGGARATVILKIEQENSHEEETNSSN